MSNWKKEPDTNWLIDLHQHISTPISCSGNVDGNGISSYTVNTQIKSHKLKK